MIKNYNKATINDYFLGKESKSKTAPRGIFEDIFRTQSPPGKRK